MTIKQTTSYLSTIAIVGGGPRGLSALESLYSVLALKIDEQLLNTLFFEGKELPGSGHVYDLQQANTNWMNVSERGLTIPSRKEIQLGDLVIPSFPSYHDWLGYNEKEDAGKERDNFPLRATFGKYLNERYVSIAFVLERAGLLTIIRGEVISTDWNEEKFNITLKDETSYQANEVVLTIGHQPTKNDDQISEWLEFSKDKNSIALVTEPYPVSSILDSKALNSSNNVALRGFGLAMIDVMRALTTGLGGNFILEDEHTRQMTYERSGKEPSKIVPFSLDGLPMAPKPLNLEIDRWFFPTENEKALYGTVLKQKSQEGEEKDERFLIDSIIPIVVRVYKELGHKAYAHQLKDEALGELILFWLSDLKFEHELIVPKTNSAKETLKAFVGMATGTNKISLDFCIGQVWRHCQPTLYKALSFSKLDDDVIGLIVQLDERLKRYSYGPPVDSLQQLLALVNDGLITLDYVNDPSIEMTKNGWKMTKESNSILVDLMVNSVLDSPKLLSINSPIVRNLLKESLVEPIHSELGIETYENACVVLQNKDDEVPLAILGRLAKGTLIGVDAILECYGVRSELWAEGVVKRNNENV